MNKYIFFPILFITISLFGCSQPKEQVWDDEKKVQVFLNNREFLVPKKYIESPQNSVETPLRFKDDSGMIAYFYWPNLEGLSEKDRPYVWDYDREIVEMTWRILSKHYISVKQVGINIKKNNVQILNGKCKWEDIVCFSIKDKDFYEWIGEIDNIGSFYIRCNKDLESEAYLENGLCNLEFDYDQKDLYIESKISNNFIKSDDDLPKIIYQMKTFVDEWEVKK